MSPRSVRLAAHPEVSIEKSSGRMPDKPDGIPSGASQTAVLPLYEWPTNRFGVRAPLPEPHIYLVRISHQLSAAARAKEARKNTFAATDVAWTFVSAAPRLWAPDLMELR